MDDRTAAIVLAGGRSRRMGTSKALLEWHGSTLLRRAVGLVARAVNGPVVVVRATDQVLPPLPPQVEIATDAREGRGPLQGIAAGVAAIGDRATVVYVSGVDAPLLHPAFVRHVVRSLHAGDDVALPRAHGFAQPLAAAYRTAALEPRLHELIARERLGTRDLFEQLAVRELDEAALLDDPDVAALDPELASLLNLNEPGEYKAARARPAPSVAVRAAGERAARAVQAATLQAAADAAGLTLTGAGIAASLDGHGDVGDPQEPLVTGDAVTFHAQGS